MNANQNRLWLGGLENQIQGGDEGYKQLYENGLAALHSQWGGDHNNGVSYENISISKKPEKNPNRVAGGIRGQGANTIAMLGEDGVERILPTQKYVQALEEQIRKQQAAINVLERKLTRVSTAQERLASQITSS